MGDVLQAFSLGVLENVVSQLDREAESPEPNGMASGKVAFPADLGCDYLYVGFDEKGYFVAEYLKDMGGKRPAPIWGPKPLAKTVNLTVGVLAHQIVSKVPKE
jgi:hypothetical protein